MSKTYYDVLGVAKNADLKEIKRKYRDLAIKHHPDRVSSEKRAEATKEMAAINKAYEILSNKESRDRYDKSLEYGVDYESYKDYESQFHEQGSDNFRDIFNYFSNGFSFFTDDRGFFHQSGTQNNSDRSSSDSSKADITISIQISLEELYNGATKTLTYNRQIICKDCSLYNSKCGKCNGLGFTSQFFMTKRCQYCSGIGIINQTNCKTCKNTRYTTIQSKININIPRGATGVLRYKNFGNELINQTGSLMIEMSLIKHPIYALDDKGNIHANLELSLIEAACGTRISLKYLDDKTHMLDIPECLNKTHVEIKDMGLRPRGNPAKLILKISIQKPPKLDEKDRAKIESIIGKVNSKIFQRV